LALPDAERGGLTIRAGAPQSYDGVHFPADGGSASVEAFESGHAAFVPDVEAAAPLSAERARVGGIFSGLAQPIIRDETALGVLGVGWATPTPALDASTRLLMRLLADEAASALSRVELVSRLESAARTDPLTGLANVRWWEEQLSRELASAGRAARPLALALIDLDGFKSLNDRLGHQAGDRVLHACSAAWQAQLRHGDLLARLGGDEFGVLLPGCSPADALGLAERLRAATQEATASIGVACWEPGEAVDDLMGRADAALYEAKAAGRDRVAAG
ncbi:MAG: sensor diguanylate cyclase, partial [Solirubrobacteraceae bacterium]|nr:sensor diguanylate cyclase [Solirubrobacteraceae bacterium]